MKKSLISALTTALVVGAASTTFAAANPFEDVPADHWAYDAIAQLAADGVIEGYGDGTYRGDQEITRYEMAQMVARAMAKGGGDKALIDKLAAEFADELNSLGVRVAALEKKVDNVKWKGWVGYENYTMITGEGFKKNGDPQGSGREVHQVLQLQLNPTMTINKNWIGRARIKYYTDMNAASNATGANVPYMGGNDDGIFLDRMWVQGNYDNLTIKLGKIYMDSAFDITEGGAGGMVMGNRLSGGIITVGNKLKATLGIGRNKRNTNVGGLDSTTDSIQFVELGYDFSKQFKAGVAYYHVRNDRAHTLNDENRFSKSYIRENENQPFGSKDRNIWEIGMTYKFSPLWLMNLAYARSNGDWETKYKQAYSFELSYGGGRYPDMSKGGNFGAFVAYRHLGRGAVIAPCYDGMYWNGGTQRGFEIGVAYSFAKNILGTALYFKGKDIADAGDRDAQQFYGALQFYF